MHRYFGPRTAFDNASIDVTATVIGFVTEVMFADFILIHAHEATNSNPLTITAQFYANPTTPMVGGLAPIVIGSVAPANSNGFLCAVITDNAAYDFRGIIAPRIRLLGTAPAGAHTVQIECWPVFSRPHPNLSGGLDAFPDFELTP